MRKAIRGILLHGSASSLLCGITLFVLTACGGGGGGGGGQDDPTVYGSYGGGEGQPPARQVDPNNPNNASLDTDCDGISDADEIALTYADRNGVAQYTDPASPDTDGDGLSDGIEMGASSVIESDRCESYFASDADPSTATSPVDTDTDGDGEPDGIEDIDQDGRVDPGDGDPNDPNSQVNPTAVNACSEENLAPVTFDRSQVSDLQMATRGFDGKQAVQIGGNDKGWLYWSSTDKIAAFALRTTVIGTDASTMAAAGQAAFATIGTISGDSTQLFTTWDGFPAAKATYTLTLNGDAKTLSNSIATRFAGAGATGWSGTAGVTSASWILRVEYVRRSATSAAVVGALVPASAYSDPVKIRVEDVVNGSAFAQSDDTGSVQCEIFQTADNAILDILWVVDNSGSMNSSQNAVKNASAAMAAVLENSPLDWRIGLVTTSYYEVPRTTGAPAERDLKGFTRDIDTVKTWFTRAEKPDGLGGFVASPWVSGTPYSPGDLVYSRPSNTHQNNYLCTAGGTAGGTAPNAYTDGIVTGGVTWNYDPRWVGTDGSSAEKALLSAKTAIATFLPRANNDATKLRPGATLVIIFLSDTEDQDTEWDVEQYKAFFDDFDGAGSKALTNGVLCPLDTTCDDNTLITGRVIGVVNNSNGIIANIADFNNDVGTADKLEEMLRNAAGATSTYNLTKSPISASLKAAMEGPTVGVCSGSPAAGPIPDVPRSLPTGSGFDYSSPTNSLLFYGDCRPDEKDKDLATSYRYWVPGTCPADGCPATCNPTCVAPLLCSEGACVCPADCGGCDSGKTCNRTTCTCTSEMGG